MFFRFGSAILLIVLISLSGVGLEKENLALKRLSSRQQFRLEALRNEHARMRWKTQKLGAPVRMIEELEQGRLPVSKPQNPVSSEPRRTPLLLWQRRSPE